MFTPTTNGLVLRLESTSGLNASGGLVSDWQDLSGSGNTLNTVVGDPRTGIETTPSGLAAITFDGGSDGNEDSLERLAGLSGLPEGFSDRTIFFVAKYDNVDEQAGFAYGENVDNHSFGLVGSDNGSGSSNLTIEGTGAGNDFISSTAAEGAGWQVHSVVVSGNVMSVYRNGELIDVQPHVFNTVLSEIVLGGDINGPGSVAMSAAAVFVYDRALDATDRGEVEAYLQDTYLGPDVSNDAPIANDDNDFAASGETINIDVINNDFDDMNEIDASTVTVVSGPSNGTIVSIDATTGVVEYQHNGTGGSDTFTYTVEDQNGNVSAQATVTVNVGEELGLTGFQQEVIPVNGFIQPLSIEYLPDNRLLVIQKSGNVMIVDPESGNSSSVMTLLNINSGDERGLLDVTLDPDFETNGHFYLFYTPANPQNARISRFTLDENAGGLTTTAELSSEVVLWEDTDGYVSCCHYGGGLDFGPDGKLWLTSADKFNTSTIGEGAGTDEDVPIDLTSTSGKIIRINKDGTIPDGTDGYPANPYIDTVNDPNSEIPDSIWAYGLRNPFRARWDEKYGQFYIAEVGGNQAGLSSDSIHTSNLDQAQAFYGWPFFEGTDNTLVNTLKEAERLALPQPDNDPGAASEGDFFSTPIFEIDRGTEGVSITGGEVYRGDLFPEEWDGVYFYGDFTRDYIRYLTLDETGTQVTGDFAFKPSTQLPGDIPNLVYLGVGTDGALYSLNFTNFGAELGRITYDNGNTAPVIDALSTGPQSGGGTLDFTFDATFSDAQSDALTYTLNFGDGTAEVVGTPDANGMISINHSYATDGFYTASLSVTDGDLFSYSAPIVIAAGNVNFAPTVDSFSVDNQFGDPGLVVQFTANVSDTEGDPLTYVLDFGDGSTPETGTVPGNGIITTSKTYNSDGQFVAFLEVSDAGSTTTSTPINIQVGAVTGNPITDGLVLSLESTIKLGIEGFNEVANWLDGSGNGNNLEASSAANNNITLVQQGTPSGLPSLRFDGFGDFLTRENTTGTPITGFPTGNDERTVFFVVNYLDPRNNESGIIFGNDANDQAFGLINAGNGGTPTTAQLGVHGFGSGNDDFSGVVGSQQGWIVQSVVMQDGGAFTHYQDGNVIDTGSNNFNTQLERIAIGVEIDGTGTSGMEVGAVFVYNRALSEAERQQVENYLQTTYIQPAPSSSPPEALDDIYATPFETSLVVDVASGLLNNDSDPDSDPFALTEINGNAVTDGQTVNLTNGDLVIDTDGSFTYSPDTDFIGQETFTYTIDDSVNGTDTASVTITVNAPSSGSVPITNGLVINLQADQNVALIGGTSTVNGWLDGSGFGNDLFAAGDPQLLANATPSGQSAIHFDGVGDKLERAGGENLFFLPSGSDDRTVFFVVDYINTNGFTGGAVFGDGAQNEAFGLTANDLNELTVQGWGATNDFSSGVDAGDNIGNDEWMVQSAVLNNNTLTQFLNGAVIGTNTHTFATDVTDTTSTLVFGEEVAGLGFLDLEVSAFLVYDRALNEAERQQIEAFLQDKYITVPTTELPDAVDDSYAVNQDTTLNVAAGTGLLSNDSDPDGHSFTVTEINGNAVTNGQTVALTNGSLTINSDGSFDYTPNGGFTGQETFTYTIDDVIDGTDTANVAIDVNATGGGTTVITDEDFEGGASGWNNNTTTDGSGQPFNFTEFLGRQAGSAGAQSLNKTYTVSETGDVTIAFDLYRLDTWDNEDMIFFINDEAVLTQTHIGWSSLGSGSGSLSGSLSGATWTRTATNNGQLGFKTGGGITQDTVYRFELTLPSYVAGNLKLGFGSTTNQGVNDESFGIDNLLITQAGSGGSTSLPDAVDDSYAVNQDTTLNVAAGTGLLNNDSDPDGHSFTVTEINGNAVTNGQTVALTNGSLTINSDGSFDYTPNGGFTGQETFTYTIDDVIDGTDTANVAIDVNAAATQLPDAVDDSYAVNQDTTLNVAAGTGLLNNDSDPDGHSFTVTEINGNAVTNGQTVALTNGSLTINSDGSFDYTPNGGFTGQETFTYTIDDVIDGTDTANVAIDVNATGGGTTVITDEDFEGGASGWNNNTTTDGSGQPFNFTEFLGRQAGSAGAQSLNKTYTVSETGDVTIAFDLYRLDTWDNEDMIFFINDEAVLTQTHIGWSSLGSGSGSLSGSLSGATWTRTATNNGQLGFKTGGGITQDTVYRFELTLPSYVAGNLKLGFGSTTNQGFRDESFGIDNLLITQAGSGGSTSLPDAVDDSYAVNQDTTLNVAAGTGLLSNDSDPDGHSFTVTEINGNAVTNGQTVALTNGSLTINSDGSFDYTPNGGFTGQESFIYTIDDVIDGADAANVTIDVNAAATQLPDAVDDSYAVNQDTTLNVAAGTGLLSNDSDPDGHSFTVTEINGNAVTNGQTVALTNGSLTINSDGSFDYTPNGGFTGQETFTYTIDDVIDGTDTANVAIDVNATGGGTTVITDEDFEGGASGWNNNTTTDGSGQPFNFTEFLGRQAGSAGAQSLNKTYTVSETGDVTIAFDLYRLDTWDNEDMIFFINDEAVLTQTHIGWSSLGSGSGSLSGSLSGATWTRTATNNGQLGFKTGGGITQDTVYRFELTLPSYVAGNLKLGFGSTTNQGVNDESFGIDNLLITQAGSGGSTSLPDAVDDSYAVNQDTTLNVAAGTGLLNNDSDPDGHSFTVTEINGNAVTNGQTVALTNGSLTINSDGSFDYTPNGGFTGQETFTYTIDDVIDGTDTANVAIDVNATGGLTVTNGLVLNLQSDAVTLGGGTTITAWDDASGSGNNLLASGDPQLLTGATPTGEDAISLDGIDDKLERLGTDTLFNLPNNNEDRTVFFVVDYINTDRATGFAFGDGAQNEAFGLVSNGNSDLIVQGWGNANDANSGVSAGDNIGTDEWLVQSVVLDQDVLTHYLNGTAIDTQAQVFATDSNSAESSIVIGEEIAGLGFGQHNVAAVLVYDRALNETERGEVETFLQQKFVDSDFVL